jgi:hypothetical protein
MNAWVVTTVASLPAPETRKSSDIRIRAGASTHFVNERSFVSTGILIPRSLGHMMTAAPMMWT